MAWVPKRTVAEADAILCAQGMPHEMENCVIDGRLQRVYSNLWPSLRSFWLWASSEYKDKTYIVFEKQRWSYGEISAAAVKAAIVFYLRYGIRKGDRVGICARNYPTYLAAFWACHLLGAVSVLANAWLPLGALHYCLAHTGCKLIIVDPERADLLEPVVAKLSEEAGTNGFLVLESHEGKGRWKGMELWSDVVARYRGDSRKILAEDPKVLPEDNATVIFTSGTTGLPKGVLSTQRMFLTNLRNVVVGSKRACLRRGEDITQVAEGPQRGILVSVPFFHVTGLTSLAMYATMSGMKVVLMRRWQSEEGSRLIQQENVGIAGGVPSMVSDLIESSSAGYPLDSLMFGGAPAPNQLPGRARKAFPNALMSQAYGMTETNSIAVAIAGEDYAMRPTSTGLPTPVNDVMIVKDHKPVPAGQVGEVWMRGPNIMKEYWRDPEATAKTITKDGWLKSGDLGLLDREGFLYIRDRLKDLIIRGGENIDSVSVENALYADPRILEVAAVGVPDQRLGELVSAIVYPKPAFQGQLSETELINFCRKSLPRFAVPVMVIIQSEPFERTPSGKITKGDLRKLAKDEWERRSSIDCDSFPKL